MTSSPSASPKRILNERFEIVSTLGSGGMGSVFQARDRRFQEVSRMVAIKEIALPAHDVDARDKTIRSFQREANILAAISHPTIPVIYDFFHDDQACFLVMEYISGQNLEEILENSDGVLLIDHIVEWAVSICDVLDYLHNQQPHPIVFRDLKPSNIMIDQHGRARLIDFGIARYLENTKKNTMIGTEGYAPPEQYRGEAGPLGDIYALGATLHHLLTNHDPRLEPPFTFDARPVRKVNPAISPGLEMIINQSLAYNKEDRFPSAAAMREALTNLDMEPTSRLSRSATMSRAIARQNIKRTRGKDKIEPSWQFTCGDEIRSQPLVNEDTVYISSYDKRLYALSTEKGRLMWRFTAEDGFAASPYLHARKIYVGAEDGHLYSLDSITGRELWSFKTDGPIRCSAVASKKHIYFGSDDGNLYALDRITGHLIWQFATGAPIRSRPYVQESENGRIFFGAENGYFYCLDMAGNERWRFESPRAFTSSPAYSDGLVIVGGVDRSLYAFESETGWLVWKFDSQRPIVSSPEIDSEMSRVYVGSADGKLYAINARNGKLVWEFATQGQVASSPKLYEAMVYFGSADHHLYCLDRATGALHWKYRTRGPVISSPTVSDDMLYIGSGDYRVYAFSL